MSLTPEERRYLDEGLRHMRRYYGRDIGEPPAGDLALALAWWANWWKARADQAALRDWRDRARRGQADLFPADADSPMPRHGPDERPS